VALSALVTTTTRKGGQTSVVALGRHVIEQQAHSHPAIGRFEEVLDKYVPREIGMEEIVLQINTALGSERE
jgi:hypothetical protein